MSLPVSTDLAATWSFIEPGLDCILGSSGGGGGDNADANGAGDGDDVGVTPKMYMNCYTAVFNFCVNKSRRGNLDLTRDPSNSYSLAGSEIYAKLDAYLLRHIRELHKLPAELFLAFYVRKWKRFTMGARYLNNVFDYMNRYWVQKERLDGRRDIYDVNTLALIKWKSEMFTENAQVLIEQILELIEAQRNCEIVDLTLISTAIKSLVFLGIDIQDLKKTNLVVYVSFFELAFLEETARYYAKESDNFLANNNVVDYMIRCEARLSEEIARSNNYLEDHTKKLLLETLNHELISKHALQMYAQFLHLLEQNESEHMQRMYRLLNRVPPTLDPLAELLQAYIKDQAAKALDLLKQSSVDQANAAGAGPGQGPNSGPGSARRPVPSVVDPRAYVNTLISIYHKYNNVVASSLDNDPRFIRALDNACRHFVNNNAIAMPTVKLASRTPDILAKYADAFLKASSKQATTADMLPLKMMTVFRFVSDKDAFEEYYRRMLAKRLINGNCKLDEMEESIIQLLQEANLVEYTLKMTKMFSDMRASEDLRLAVKDRIAGLACRDFYPLVLAHSMWPFTHLSDYDLRVAPELEQPFAEAVNAYGAKHLGRQLKWLWNHGRAEIKAHLSKPDKPPFLFTVSNVQLMIILAFNRKNLYLVQELHAVVGTSPHIFDAHLLPLTRYKLIEQLPPGPDHASNPNTILTMVTEYKLRKLRVNFILAIKTNEPRQEQEEAQTEIDETRKNYLLACIVRIMKSRKVVAHNDLINEVLPQTATRFQAKIIDIKRVIDHLIEKQYIQRVDGNLYEYLS